MAETARDLLMSNTMAQWLYVISDTNAQNGNLSNLITDLYEGENVAYIFNLTDNSPDCKVRFDKYVVTITFRSKWELIEKVWDIISYPVF